MWSTDMCPTDVPHTAARTAPQCSAAAAYRQRTQQRAHRVGCNDIAPIKQPPTYAAEFTLRASTLALARRWEADDDDCRQSDTEFASLHRVVCLSIVQIHCCGDWGSVPTALSPAGTVAAAVFGTDVELRDEANFFVFFP